MVTVGFAFPSGGEDEESPGWSPGGLLHERAERLIVAANTHAGSQRALGVRDVLCRMAIRCSHLGGGPPPCYVPGRVRVFVAFGVCGEGRGAAEPRTAHPCPATAVGHDAANTAGVIQFNALCGRW